MQFWDRCGKIAAMKGANPEANALYWETKRHLGQIENISRALIWVKKHREELQSRADEFDSNLALMITLSENPQALDPNLYPNLIELIQDIEWPGDLRPLSEIVQTHRDRRGINPHPLIIESVKSTFELVNRKIISREWTFPTTITNNPGKLASGLLIEGYGLFLKDYHATVKEKPNLSREFVLAFEEVLFMHRPNSKLLADVRDWMKEEAAGFSPYIAARLQDNPLQNTRPPKT